MNDEIMSAIRSAAALLQKSRKTVVFTGAGISVESGVPPFRGSGGIWEMYDQSILDIDRYYSDTHICWLGIKDLFYSSMTQAKPNEAHMVLARWEQCGKIAFTITQNIDGLHQTAGTQKIAEFHGNVKSMVCRSCTGRFPIEQTFLNQNIPVCPHCGGVLKPDFVFFGEGIPEKAADDSYSAASSCSCMIIIGSSGEVYPAAGLPQIAKRSGASIIEINPNHSSYTDSITDVYIETGAVAALHELDTIVTA